jgi:ATP adenylyltransferase
MNECSLCKVADNNSKKSILNKTVFEWNNFLLIPSVGPIDIGHFLIVSKKHNSGLATMPLNEIEDFFKFANFIKSKLTSTDLLFFEHGSYDNQDAGSCISHTHIHVLPKYSDCFSILDSTLDIAYKNFSISQFAEIDFPYIMTLNTSDNSRIYKAYNVHSQMMRKAICSKKHLSNWDWKADKNIKLIKQGIDFWTNVLK